jgi:hypothetical protein
MKRALFLIAALAVPAAEAAYRCTDAKGTTHVGDTPPAACAKIPMEEVSKSGKVLRTIEPTLSAEEAAAREEAEEKKREEEKIIAEQKRKDLALLATYASEKEFDVARDRNVEPLEGRIKSSQERSKDLDKRIKELQEEMEFYKAGKKKDDKKAKGGIPPQLQQDMDAAVSEKALMAKNVTQYEKEITDIKAKFEADKKRWLQLKGRKPGEEDKPAPKKRASSTPPATPPATPK